MRLLLRECMSTADDPQILMLAWKVSRPSTVPVHTRDRVRATQWYTFEWI